jgi:hypothetical protein
MGLDQYAFAVKDDERIEIMYWRKHANLEGWMADLYKQRGGKGDFNCVDLKLFEDDILRLRKEHRELRKASGFFWGQSSLAKVENTHEFIQKALQYQSEGYDIIYTSWW